MTSVRDWTGAFWSARSGATYRVEQRLGEGAFGTVWLAHNTQTRVPVAIKRLHVDALEPRDRLNREAWHLWRERGNRFVVQILDEGVDSGEPFIVMEFCEYRSLESWITNRRPWEDVAAAMSCAIQGLIPLHAEGGFHRDIKPANLLLALDRTLHQYVVKVSDFGLARSPSAHSGLATQRGIGDTRYADPDVYVRGSPYTARADIFSLGITTLELLTGERRAEALIATAGPESLKRLVRDMSSFEPERRPDGATIVAALDALFVPPHQQPVPASAAVQATPAAMTPGAKALVGGLAVAGIAGLLHMLASGQRDEWDDRVAQYRGPDGRFRGK